MNVIIIIILIYSEISDEFKKQINNNEYIDINLYISKYIKTKKKLKIIQENKEKDKEEDKQQVKQEIKIKKK